MLPQRKLRVLLLLRFLRRHHTEILHDLPRQDQSRNGRNKRDTSRNCAALGAFMLAPGGQIQFFRQLMLMSSCCSTGGSVE